MGIPDKEEFLKTALELTNKHRARHGAPPLTLDATLCADAQAYAEYEEANNVNKHSRDQLDEYGENLAYKAFGTAPTGAAAAEWAVNSWYDEVTRYPFSAPCSGDLASYMHFSALIWKGTTKMGIGIAYGSKMGKRMMMTTVYVVARYLPAGNLQTAEAFQENHGLRVVGSAGDDAKVQFLLKELRFDAAFNYKHCDGRLEGFDQALNRTCPDGVDIYFDGVGGGVQLDVVLTRANELARIVVCGDLTDHGPLANVIQMMYKRMRMKGFILFEDWANCFQEFVATFVGLVQEGRLQYPEHVVEGIENAPAAFVDSLCGKYFGKKAVVKVAEL